MDCVAVENVVKFPGFFLKKKSFVSVVLLDFVWFDVMTMHQEYEYLKILGKGQHDTQFHATRGSIHLITQTKDEILLQIINSTY